MKKTFKRLWLHVLLIGKTLNTSGIICFFRLRHKFDPIEVEAHYLHAKCYLCKKKLYYAKSSNEYKNLLEENSRFLKTKGMES